MRAAREEGRTRRRGCPEWLSVTGSSGAPAAGSANARGSWKCAAAGVRGAGRAGAGEGGRMLVGFPAAARFAVLGRRLLTQALPPASLPAPTLPAPSQTQPRVPISTPTQLIAAAPAGCNLPLQSGPQPRSFRVGEAVCVGSPADSSSCSGAVPRPHPFQPSPELEG